MAMDNQIGFRNPEVFIACEELYFNLLLSCQRSPGPSGKPRLRVGATMQRIFFLLNENH